MCISCLVSKGILSKLVFLTYLESQQGFTRMDAADNSDDSFRTMLKSRVGAIACADTVFPIVHRIHRTPSDVPCDDDTAKTSDSKASLDRLALLLHSITVASGRPFLKDCSEAGKPLSTKTVSSSGNLHHCPRPIPIEYRSPLPNLSEWHAILFPFPSETEVRGSAKRPRSL